jgi:hypothetical protein
MHPSLVAPPATPPGVPPYAGRVLDLPRSVLLALWGTAVLDGRVDAARAVDVVTGSDEPHLVTGEDQPVSASPLGPGLHDLLEHLAGRTVGLRAALPVPGDALGLPPVPEAVRAAVDAEEAVVAVPAGPGAAAWTWVPQVEAFGSEHDQGHQVRWRCWRHPEAARAPVTAFSDLGEAERGLRTELTRSADALAGLDVARWRDDAADGIAGVRSAAADGRVLPPGLAPRAVRVLGTASRVRGIVALASVDDGGAVSGWEADRRSTLLRALDATARRALVAAASPEIRPR